MRVSFAVAILLALTFAGCSDKKGGTDDDHDHETYECPDGTNLDLEDIEGHDNASFNPADHCPDDGGNNGNNGNNTSTPNVPPVLILKTLDAPGGNETNVTMLGGSITFTAEGSSDPDGSIAGIAVTVTDGNSSRTAALYAGGQFVPQTFVFDRAGIVNVTAAMVDNRAGFSIQEKNVYVNQVFVLNVRGLGASDPGSAIAGADECAAGSPSGVVDNFVSDRSSITVEANASYIEVVRKALPQGVTQDYAICTPDNTPLSGELSGPGPYTSTNTEPLPASSDYAIFTMNRGRPTQGTEGDGTYTVTVHYDPMAAAPAA